MKKLLFTAALIFSACVCFSQQSAVEVIVSEFPTYQGVVSVPGVSRADIYSRAKAWVATAYNSAQDVIQLDDKESGRLIVKGNTIVPMRSLGMEFGMRVHNTLTIEARDGRFRYTILVTDVISEADHKTSQMRHLYKDNRRAIEYKDRVRAEFEQTLASLHNGILSNSIGGGDDW